MRNKGQIITWILGVITTAIVGISANQYNIVQRTAKLETIYETTQQEIKKLNDKFDSITDIKIKSDKIEKKLNNKLK